MNREIKFRAWNKNYKAWGDKHGAFIFAQEINLSQYSADYIFQQFTGLKDKDGREIYEGDIIQLTFKGIKSSRPLVVRYFDEMACFYLHNNLAPVKYWNDIFKSIQTIFSEKITVIGNIFENPELLKWSRPLSL